PPCSQFSSKQWVVADAFGTDEPLGGRFLVSIAVAALDLDRARDDLFQEIALRVQVTPENRVVVAGYQRRRHLAPFRQRAAPLLALLAQPDGRQLEEHPRRRRTRFYDVLALLERRQDEGGIVEAEVARLAAGPRPGADPAPIR